MQRRQRQQLGRPCSTKELVGWTTSLQTLPIRFINSHWNIAYRFPSELPVFRVSAEHHQSCLSCWSFLNTNIMDTKELTLTVFLLSTRKLYLRRWACNNTNWMNHPELILSSSLFSHDCFIRSKGVNGTSNQIGNFEPGSPAWVLGSAGLRIANENNTYKLVRANGRGWESIPMKTISTYYPFITIANSNHNNLKLKKFALTPTHDSNRFAI